jgi:2'-5' RNA ligase
MSAHPHLPAGGFCIRNVNREFVEWHCGRPRYVLWAIDANFPGVQSRVEAAQFHLDGLLLEAHTRQPHITLTLCGFPSAQPLLPDEFGRALLDQQVASLQQAQISPIDIAIGALSSFASAPYLGVTDGSGGITNLRSCLGTDADTHAYTPHVTVGLYKDAWPTNSVRPRLTAFVPCPAIPLRVTRIGLFAYETSSVGGRLESLATFDLEEKHLLWHATPLFGSEHPV